MAKEIRYKKVRGFSSQNRVIKTGKTCKIDLNKYLYSFLNPSKVYYLFPIRFRMFIRYQHLVTILRGFSNCIRLPIVRHVKQLSISSNKTDIPISNDIFFTKYIGLWFYRTNIHDLKKTNIH